MMSFFSILKQRNPTLYWFGWANLVTTLALLVCSVALPMEYAGVNAWYKPTKFALTTVIFAWTTGWYTGHLQQTRLIQRYNWVIILTLGFEVVYIALQASRGMASHYNQSSPLYSGLFVLMAIAATVATLATGYLGPKFKSEALPDLSPAYVLAIRLGIYTFVVFSLEGFLMGKNLSHTVGAADGVRGLPFLGWSYDHGDLRMAHFFGMHALQVLPIAAYYVLKRPWQVWLLAALYFLLSAGVLVLALMGKGVLLA